MTKKKSPVALEATESVPYGSIPRDPAEIEAGRALGPMTAPRKIYDLCAAHLAKESQEVFLVLPLDLRGQMLSGKPVEVARGQRDRVTVDSSDIFRPVIVHNAKGFVVVHVHPSGQCRPSPADKRLTTLLFEQTRPKLGEVRFVDHVIIASSEKRGEYYSFREHMTVTGDTCHFKREARIHAVRHGR